MARSNTLTIALVAIVALLAGACGGKDKPMKPARTGSTTTSSTAPAADTVAPAGTYGVGSVERIYVDRTRPTTAHGGQPELPSRTLRTVVLYPTQKEANDAGTPVAGAAALPGPWPLILFAHGSTRKAADYLATLSWWASAGYVVVAPNFPLSTEGTPGGTAYGDYPAQTADESFIIDSVTTDHDGSPDLAALIYPDRIGLGGQSFGAITTLGTVAASCCADARVKAATEFAGVWLPFPSGDELAPHASQVPVLFVHGDQDPTLQYQADHDFWTRLGAPGGFLTLVGGGHDDGYFGGDATPVDELVAQVTLAFYDEYLKGDSRGPERIRSLVDAAGDSVARLELSHTG